MIIIRNVGKHFRIHTSAYSASKPPVSLLLAFLSSTSPRWSNKEISRIAKFIKRLIWCWIRIAPSSHLSRSADRGHLIHWVLLIVGQPTINSCCCFALGTWTLSLTDPFLRDFPPHLLVILSQLVVLVLYANCRYLHHSHRSSLCFNGIV